MIVSKTEYYLICIMIPVLLWVLMYILNKRKKINELFFLIPPIFVVPFLWYTPYVIEVHDLENYTEKVLIYPVDHMHMGHGTYIMNQTKRLLIFREVVYGNAIQKEDDQVCMPGEQIRCNVSIDYIMKSAPSIMRTDGSGTTRNQLTYM